MNEARKIKSTFFVLGEPINHRTKANERTDTVNWRSLRTMHKYDDDDPIFHRTIFEMRFYNKKKKSFGITQLDER